MSNLLRLFPYALLAASSPVIPNSNIDRHHNHDDQQRLVVETTSGSFIPTISDDGPYPDVAEFLDIPYAESPEGELRFAAPVPVTKRSTTPVQATSLPAGCFQYIPTAFQGTLATDGRPEFNLQYGDFGNTTEDCLHLSVFAPKGAVTAAAGTAGTGGKRDVGCDEDEEGESLPVLVWIHGGGFQFGGINVPYQLPQPWIQRSQKHIVVSVQYRLGLLGLPNAAGMMNDDSDDINSSVNLFLLDQLLAVQWVHDNIANFGGDPSRITLWGQSAGGYAVDSLPFISPSPHVVGVIAHSGNAIGMGATSIPKGSNTDHSLFSTAAASLGCGGSSSSTPEEELACMRAVPASEIKTYLQDGGAAADNMTYAGVADDLTIFGDYASLMASSNNNSSSTLSLSLPPLLFGTTADEGNAVVPYDFPGSLTATELPEALATISDQFTSSITCFTKAEVEARSSSSMITTYQYLYTGNFTNNISPRPWLGAYHTSDLPLFFGTAGTLGDGENTAFQDGLSEKLQDYWLAFVEDPESGLSEKGWVAASSSSGAESMMMKFGTEKDGVMGKLVGSGGYGEWC